MGSPRPKLFFVLSAFRHVTQILKICVAFRQKSVRLVLGTFSIQITFCFSLFLKFYMNIHVYIRNVCLMFSFDFH